MIPNQFSTERKKKAMDLEIEIPIWYLGRMKWISNLTTRSTCSDIIEAILAADECRSEAPLEYVLFESWRGVERPLKGRCRLLKLWHSWARESDNVTLTLRPRQQHPLLVQQDKKLDKLKRELKRTDRAIKRFTTHTEISLEETNAGSDCLVSYLCICRSILRAHAELERQQTLITQLNGDIERETKEERQEETDLPRLLVQVNDTLINSRRLTEQSDELDEQISRTNEEIDRRQLLLDELELDLALDEQIDMTLDHDSLEDEEDLQQERVSTSPPPVIPPRTRKVASCRPTAIVEPSPSFASDNSSPLSSMKMNVCRSRSLVNVPSDDSSRRIQRISFPVRCPWSSSLDESDTGISSLNSTCDSQLITLV